MNQIELLCVGRLKFRELETFQKRYLQKINYYVKFSIKILKEKKISDEKALRIREGKMMLETLGNQDFVVSLDEKGRKMDSRKFAGYIEKKSAALPGRLVFLIGGHSGISPEVKSRVNDSISFSDMTFPHDIFRILFLEQLYRAFTIIKGQKYHR